MSWNVISDFMKTKNRVKGLDLFSFCFAAPLWLFWSFSLFDLKLFVHHSSLGANQLQNPGEIFLPSYLFLYLLNKPIWPLNSQQLTTLKFHNIKITLSLMAAATQSSQPLDQLHLHLKSLGLLTKPHL